MVDSSTSPDAVSAAIIKSYFKSDCRRAAKHHNGAGIEDGVNVGRTLAVLRTLKSN